MIVSASEPCGGIAIGGKNRANNRCRGLSGDSVVWEGRGGGCRQGNVKLLLGVCYWGHPRRGEEDDE